MNPQLAGEAPGRIAPLRELVNVHEVEAMAQRKLDPLRFAEIAGSDRRAFDRITFRPRMMVESLKLDLTLELFGQKLFAPVIAGPMALEQRFHPEGEMAVVRGATAAKAVMVVAAKSSVPLEKIAEHAGAQLWFQVNPESDVDAVRGRAAEAVKLGCKAVVLTLGAPSWDWAAIDRFRKGLNAPLVLKGITDAGEAKAAVERGIEGLVVSSYRGGVSGLTASIEALPGIVDAVAGRVPVLADGSFRRGTDIMKALAFGARAVLIGRPVVWGLAGYGADGVQYVLEMLQTELARVMAMCGRPSLKQIDRTVVRVHRPIG